MPSSAVRTFTDPDDYTAAMRATTVDMTVTARGRFVGKLVRIDLHRLWMQRFRDNLPRVAHAANMAGRAILSFRTEAGPSLLADGREMNTASLIRHGQADDYYQRSAGSACYGAMSLAVEEMASVGEAMGLDLTPPLSTMPITPPPAAMARLHRLHAAAGHLAEEAPEIIANPEAARELEQALIEAMVVCLDARHHRETSLAQGQHAIVMRRFRRVVEENPEQPLYIPEICKAIRISGRTLRDCCQEHLGMGPKRFLLLRRMHLARRALREAVPDATSVTDTATRYGFWQLGRFAVEYQSLFGESPSVTLRRQSE